MDGEGAAAESTAPVMLGREVSLQAVTENIARTPHAALMFSGGVQQERERGTKSMSSGFRKMVWKDVWLELKETQVQLWKTSEREKSHGIVALRSVIECTAGQGAETGPTFTLKYSTGGGGTTTWVLKLPTLDMANTWKMAVMHNKSVMPTDSTWRTGG